MAALNLKKEIDQHILRQMLKSPHLKNTGLIFVPDPDNADFFILSVIDLEDKESEPSRVKLKQNSIYRLSDLLNSLLTIGDKTV